MFLDWTCKVQGLGLIFGNSKESTDQGEQSWMKKVY